MPDGFRFITVSAQLDRELKCTERKPKAASGLRRRLQVRAEREGFEPSVPVRAHRFSRPAHSAALAPLQFCGHPPENQSLRQVAQYDFCQCPSDWTLTVSMHTCRTAVPASQPSEQKTRFRQDRYGSSRGIGVRCHRCVSWQLIRLRSSQLRVFPAEKFGRIAGAAAPQRRTCQILRIFPGTAR